MPLSPEQEWTLVACGLLALADRVLTSGEASRLLALVEAYLDPEEQDQWMDLVSDRAALDAHFSRMQPPPAENHLALLEKVWNVALADGDTSLVEIRVFDLVGERLGIHKAQLAVLRKGWTYEAMERSEIIAGFVANLLHRGGPPTDEDRAEYEALLARLPLSAARRERVSAAIDTPPVLEVVATPLRRLSRERQMDVLRTICHEILRLRRRGDARALMVELVEAGGIPGSVVGDLRGLA